MAIFRLKANVTFEAGDRIAEACTELARHFLNVGAMGVSDTIRSGSIILEPTGCDPIGHRGMTGPRSDPENWKPEDWAAYREKAGRELEFSARLIPETDTYECDLPGVKETTWLMPREVFEKLFLRMW